MKKKGFRWLRRMHQPTMLRLGVRLAQRHTRRLLSSVTRFDFRGEDCATRVAASLSAAAADGAHSFSLASFGGQRRLGPPISIAEVVGADLGVQMPFDDDDDDDEGVDGMIEEGDEEFDAADEWCVASRVAPLSRAPIMCVFASSESGELALPIELADESLLALEPARLAFVVACRETVARRTVVKDLFKKLEALFPGAPAMCVVLPGDSTPSTRQGCDDIQACGAALVDAACLVRELTAALAELSPLDVRHNDAAARLLFLPSAVPCFDAPPPRLGGTPLFEVSGLCVAPGETLNLRIFEPRYKLMVKEAMDESSCFVIAPPAGTVGTACRVVNARHSSDGRSEITVVGERRVAPQVRSALKAEFYLYRAQRLLDVVDDDDSVAEPSVQPEKEALANILVAKVCDALELASGDDDVTSADAEGIAHMLRNDIKRDPTYETFSWTLARWLGSLEPERKSKWLEMRSTLERLRSQHELITRFALVKARAKESDAEGSLS